MAKILQKYYKDVTQLSQSANSLFVLVY